MTKSLGIEFAAMVRDQILSDLHAESEWTIGNSDSEEIWWWPGPATTSLRVASLASTVPHLGALIVETYCGIDVDLDRARSICSILNLSTSLTRWVIVNDPVISNLPSPRHGGRLVMCATNTFIFGGPEANLPLSAVEMIIQEQIAKANALMIHGFFTPESADGLDRWCSPFIARPPSDQLRVGNFNDSCSYFDDLVLPFSDSQVEWNALIAAFVRARDSQLSGEFGDSGAWFGNGGAGGLTFEVPFEDRDWNGVITVTAFDPPAKTALVRCSTEQHTHLANGILVRAQLPFTPGVEEVDEVVRELNMNGNTSSFGAFHVLGTWVNFNNEPWYTAFIPNSWSRLLEFQDQAWFYDQLFSNIAREVMAARSVLGFSSSNDPEMNDMSGFLAGEDGRGYAYGELPRSLFD